MAETETDKRMVWFKLDRVGSDHKAQVDTGPPGRRPHG